MNHNMVDDSDPSYMSEHAPVSTWVQKTTDGFHLSCYKQVSTQLPNPSIHPSISCCLSIPKPPHAQFPGLPLLK